MSRSPHTRVGGIALVLLAAFAALYVVGGIRDPEGVPAADDPARVPAQGGGGLDAPGSGVDRSRSAVPAASPAIGKDVSAAREAGELFGSYLGTVVDPDETPIEGAHVRLLSADEGDRSMLDPIASGETDAAGGYEIPVPAGVGAERKLRIEVAADGFATWSFAGVFANKAMHLVLPWAAELQGVVVDADTGSPVPGARVTRGEQVETTAFDGRFRFEGVIVGRTAELLVQHDEYAFARVPVKVDARPSTRCEVRLEPGVPLGLTVFNRETGVPIVGAIVRVWGRGLTLATTDASGAADLRVDRAESIELEIRADGYAVFQWTFDVIDAETLRSIRVPMVAPSWIEGVLHDVDGTPLPGAYLSAESDSFDSGHEFDEAERVEYGLPGYAQYTLPDEWSRPTDQAGRFEIPVLASEEPYTLSGGEPRLVRVQHGPVWVREARTRVWVDLVQRVGGTLRGVVFRNGKPFPRGRVVIEGEGDVSTGAWISENGGYLANRVPAGTASVWLRCVETGGTIPKPATVTITAGEETVHDFRWEEATAPIAGVVVGPDDAPAAGVYVFAMRFDEEGHFASLSTRSGEDGAFRFEAIAGPPYHVLASLGMAEADGGQVEAGTEDLELRLPEMGYLRVRLIEAETRDPVRPMPFDTQSLAWRSSGENAFHPTVLREVVNGVVDLELPVTTSARLVDLFVTMSDEGYIPRCFESLALALGDDESPVVELELERGVDCTLALGSQGELTEQLRGHLVFVLREDEVDRVRGPFPVQDGGLSNQRINGLNMWLGRPGLTHQLVFFSDLGMSLVRGLRPGRYTLRAFPGDFTFEPEMFEVRESGQRVEVDIRSVTGSR